MSLSSATPAARAPQIQIAACASALLILLGSLTFISANDQAAGRLTLGFLQPAISLLSKFSAFTEAEPLRRVTWWGGGLALLLGIIGCIAQSMRRTRPAALVLLGCGTGLAAELLLLNGATSWGLLAFAAGLVLVSRAVSHQNVPSFEPAASVLPESRTEWLVLGMILVVAALLRFYGLNRLPNFFEGELSAYSAGATRLGGIAAANKGLNGPWAPLGLLYYVPIYLATSLLGTNLLALRISSAWVGVLTVPLLYFFARGISGRRTAQFAAMLFSLDQLHIGWSRTDVHPHGVTTWPALLLALCLLRALRTGKFRWWFCSALCMGLSWHQYPSGQSAVALPLLALGLLCFSNQKLPPRGQAALIFMPLGVLLWYFGLPLSYYVADWQWSWLNPFTLTSVRTSWGVVQDQSLAQQLWDVAALVSRNFYDLVQGIFIAAPQLHFQDQLPHYMRLGARTLAWPIAACFALSLPLLAKNWRRPEAIILFSFLVVAILPGVLSEKLYPKRASTFFPAAECCAAIFISWFVQCSRGSLGRAGQVIAALPYLGLIFYAVLSCRLWFSEDRWQYGISPEEQIVRDLSSETQPNTIFIVDAGISYLEAKLTYLMLDQLSNPENRPNLWLRFKESGPAWDTLLSNPAQAVQYLERPDWTYHWTKLAPQLKESIQNQNWRRVVWIVQQREGAEAMISAQKVEQVQRSCPTLRRRSYPPTRQLPFLITVMICEPPIWPNG